MRTLNQLLIALACLILVSGNTPSAQTPKPKSKPAAKPSPKPPSNRNSPSKVEPESGTAPETKAPGGTLLILCDRDCSVAVDGNTPREASASGSLSVAVGLGQHFVRATGGGADWEQVVELKSLVQLIVKVDLIPKIAEQQERQRAADAAALAARADEARAARAAEASQRERQRVADATAAEAKRLAELDAEQRNVAVWFVTFAAVTLDGMRVLTVDPKGPSARVLKSGDRLLTIERYVRPASASSSVGVDFEDHANIYFERNGGHFFDRISARSGR